MDRPVERPQSPLDPAQNRPYNPAQSRSFDLAPGSPPARARFARACLPQWNLSYRRQQPWLIGNKWRGWPVSTSPGLASTLPDLQVGMTSDLQDRAYDSRNTARI